MDQYKVQTLELGSWNMMVSGALYYRRKLYRKISVSINAKCKNFNFHFNELQFSLMGVGMFTSQPRL